MTTHQTKSEKRAMQARKIGKSCERGGLLLTIMVALAIVGAVLVLSWGTIAAPAADVEEVITLAGNNPEAVAALKQGLAEHPAPTNGQLAEIRRAVNEAVVLQRSRSVTGNLALERADGAATKANELDKDFAGGAELLHPFAIALVVVIALGILAHTVMRTGGGR